MIQNVVALLMEQIKTDADVRREVLDVCTDDELLTELGARLGLAKTARKWGGGSVLNIEPDPPVQVPPPVKEPVKEEPPPPPPSVTLTLGGLLRTARETADMTAGELAAEFGVHPRTVWKWESDEVEFPYYHWPKAVEILPISDADLLAAKKETHSKQLTEAEMKEFAVALRNARRAAGLMQHEVARRARLSQGTISRYELGRILPSPDQIDPLLAVFPAETRKNMRKMWADLAKR